MTEQTTRPSESHPTRAHLAQRHNDAAFTVCHHLKLTGATPSWRDKKATARPLPLKCSNSMRLPSKVHLVSPHIICKLYSFCLSLLLPIMFYTFSIVQVCYFYRAKRRAVQRDALSVFFNSLTSFFSYFFRSIRRSSNLSFQLQGVSLPRMGHYPCQSYTLPSPPPISFSPAHRNSQSWPSSVKNSFNLSPSATSFSLPSEPHLPDEDSRTGLRHPLRQTVSCPTSRVSISR